MRHLGFGVLFSVVALTACGSEPEQAQDKPETQEESAELVGQSTLANSDGEEVGQVSFTVTGEVLSLQLDAATLPAGESGFHLHTTGLCDGPDFKSAGGHLNPMDREHGAENPSGKHLGDLPNISIGEDGSAQASIIVSDDPSAALAAIFDEDGSAVMIHAEPDDYQTDPTGNAGSRIACGVITPTE